MKRKIIAVMAAVLLFIGGSAALPSLLHTAQAVAAVNGVPTYDHIVVLVEENHTYSEIVGNTSAPYFNSLASSGASLTQMIAESHPSQPNYLAMYSGSTQGTTDDSFPHTFNSNSLGAQLAAAGESFAGYTETTCCVASYHSPWNNTWNPATPAGANLDMSQFPGDFTQLPKVSFVIPDKNNDMHDGTIATADSWAQSHLDTYLQWAKTHNSLLITTWDENDSSTSPNQIATFFDGANVAPGQYGAQYNHYNLLATIEDSMGVGRINNSVGAADIPVFSTSTASPTATATATSTASPSPTATAAPATATSTCPGNTPTGDGTTAASTLGWGTPVAGDEFNYSGAPDPTKWNVYVGAGNAGQGQRVASANSVGCNMLTITGDAAGNTGGMGSKFGQKYGRWETRMMVSQRIPEYHPVSIVWPDNDASTTCQEIDYAEGWGGDLTHMQFNLHTTCSNVVSGANNYYGTAWHNYAVDWEPGSITGYVDGVQYFTDTNAADLAALSLSSHQTLQLDWFPDSGTTSQTQMFVDWTRYYAPASASPSPSPTSTATATATPTATATATATPTPTATATATATATPTATATATATPTATATSTPAPTSAQVLLSPLATAGTYNCTVDMGTLVDVPCDIRFDNDPPLTGTGRAHVHEGLTNGAYACTVAYEDNGWAGIPCSITSIP